MPINGYCPPSESSTHHKKSHSGLSILSDGQISRIGVGTPFAHSTEPSLLMPLKNVPSASVTTSTYSSFSTTCQILPKTVSMTEEKAVPASASDKIPEVPLVAFCFGNPFQLNSTVTAGIVSAKSRNLGMLSPNSRLGIESFIQTDAAVNPGNSGGALVNTSGELVGINTAIYSETGNYAGYSFAIPTSIVSKVITDLKQYGTVQRAMLGVSIMEMNDHLAKEKKIDLRKGVYVAEVSERSAAMEADLKPGDVIVAINGVATPTVAILQEQIARYRPGDKVKIEFFRGKDKKQSDAVLKNSYGNTDVTKATNIDMLGATLKEAGDSVKAKLRIRGGVEVVKVKEGQFKKAGIHDGFVILDINGTKIMNVKDVESVFQSLMRGDARDKVMFIKGLYQNGRASYYAVPLVD